MYQYNQVTGWAIIYGKKVKWIVNLIKSIMFKVYMSNVKDVIKTLAILGFWWEGLIHVQRIINK